MTYKIYRNKTYVCFDGDNDIRFYRLMQAWKAKDNKAFNFHDAHDINNIWANSNEDTIKRRLRERMKNTKLLIVLVGEKTKNLYRFVKWEMEVALKLEIPIVAVNLNKIEGVDRHRCPPIIREKLVLHIPYNKNAIRWAIDNWIDEQKTYLIKNEIGPIQLNKDAY